MGPSFWEFTGVRYRVTLTVSCVGGSYSGLPLFPSIFLSNPLEWDAASLDVRISCRIVCRESRVPASCEWHKSESAFMFQRAEAKPGAILAPREHPAFHIIDAPQLSEWRTARLRPRLKCGVQPHYSWGGKELCNEHKAGRNFNSPLTSLTGICVMTHWDVGRKSQSPSHLKKNKHTHSISGVFYITEQRRSTIFHR